MLQFPAVPSVVGEEEYVTVISPNEVYYDDSGTQPGSDVFIWAGYLAPMMLWRDFSKDWNARLAEEPALPFWHTSHAHMHKGVFGKLNKADIQEKEEALAKTIASYGSDLVAFVIRLPVRYWREHVEGKITFGSELDENERRDVGIDLLDKQQYVAFHEAAMSAAGFTLRQKSGLPVHFIYEQREGDRYEHHILQTWNQTRAHARPPFAGLLGTLSFTPGKNPNARPLEAADMLAWHINRRADRIGQDQPFWEHICKTHMNERTLGIHELNEYVRHWNEDIPHIPTWA